MCPVQRAARLKPSLEAFRLFGFKQPESREDPHILLLHLDEHAAIGLELLDDLRGLVSRRKRWAA
jgi:hypothetical protein